MGCDNKDEKHANAVKEEKKQLNKEDALIDRYCESDKESDEKLESLGLHNPSFCLRDVPLGLKMPDKTRGIPGISCFCMFLKLI